MPGTLSSTPSQPPRAEGVTPNFGNIGNRGPPNLLQRVCAALAYIVPAIDTLSLGDEFVKYVPQFLCIHELPSEKREGLRAERVEWRQRQQRSARRRRQLHPFFTRCRHLVPNLQYRLSRPTTLPSSPPWSSSS